MSDSRNLSTQAQSVKQARLGVLHLLPTPIADITTPEQLRLVLPDDVIQLLASLRLCLVENAKSARAVLKLALALYPQGPPLQARTLCEFERAPQAEVEALLQQGVQGEALGLLSEAGMPAVADPGRELVLRARQLGLQVKAHSGPSSIMLGLAASGLMGQRFSFHGYLPVESAAREQALLELEHESRAQDATQLFIETPYRNQALWQAMLRVLAPPTYALAAQGLTGAAEQVLCDQVSALRRKVWLPDSHAPCLFGLYHGHHGAPRHSRAQPSQMARAPRGKNPRRS